MLIYPDFSLIRADEPARVTRLSGDSLVFLQTALFEISSRWKWRQSVLTDELLTDAQWDELDAALAKAAGELMTSALIGQMAVYLTENPPYGVLPCDGTTYLREDYPELYALLDAAFVIDADHFFLPDMSGRTIVGVGSLSGDTYALGVEGGEARHVLSVTEMPSHGHTDTGHIHSTGNSLTGLALAPGEEPVLLPNPLPGATGSASANITNTGGDGAHENRMPFLPLKLGVYAW